jgi:hypothetical protein
MTELFSPTKVAQQLEAAGMNHAQVLIIAQGLEASRNGVATKADLDAAVQALRAEITAVAGRMEARMDVQFRALTSEFEAQLAKLEARLETRIAALDSRLGKVEAGLVVMRWGFGLMFTLQFGILAKLFFP